MLYTTTAVNIVCSHANDLLLKRCEKFLAVITVCTGIVVLPRSDSLCSIFPFF